MGIEKHLTITGTSTVSWKDAVVQAVAEASKTLDYLSSVRVLDQTNSILCGFRHCIYNRQR